MESGLLQNFCLLASLTLFSRNIFLCHTNSKWKMPYPIQNSKKSNNETILVFEKQPYTLVLMTLVLFETGCRFLCFLDKLHKTDNLCVILLNLFVFIPRTVLQQSHKNEKIGALLTFLFELEISGVGLQIIHQNSKKQWLCEELLSENDFETILAPSVVMNMVSTLLRQFRISLQLQIKKIVTNALCVLQFAEQLLSINNSEKKVGYLLTRTHVQEKKHLL